MAEIEKTPTEFLIEQMEMLDDVVQILICTRQKDGTINYSSCGQIACDTLGMLEFVAVAAKEHLRRELYAGEDH